MTHTEIARHEGIIFYSANNSASGTPRTIVHFTAFFADDFNRSVLPYYDEAVKIAKSIGGKIFRGSSFGGGIIFNCWDEKKLAAKIKAVQIQKQ